MFHVPSVSLAPQNYYSILHKPGCNVEHAETLDTQN